jgi:hypothetical protein
MENNNKEQRILNSLDGFKKAAAPDFFYTRLIGRMQHAQSEKNTGWQLRPVILTVSLSVVFLLNIIVLTRLNTNTAAGGTVPSVTSAGESNAVQSFANAYNLNMESVYE